MRISEAGRNIKKEEMEQEFTEDEKEMFLMLTADYSKYSGVIGPTITRFYKEGNLDFCKWLRLIGVNLCSGFLATIAEYGHRHIIIWLKEIGVEWNDRAVAECATNGDLSMIKWLVEQGCPYGDQAIVNATIYKHLDIIKWLIHRGEHYDKVFVMTSPYQDVILGKLRQQRGCYWNKLVTEHASGVEHKDILEWIKENPCPGNCMNPIEETD